MPRGGVAGNRRSAIASGATAARKGLADPIPLSPVSDAMVAGLVERRGLKEAIEADVGQTAV